MSDAREELEKSDQEERLGIGVMLRRTVAKFTWQLRRIFKAQSLESSLEAFLHSTVEVADLREK